MLARLSPDSERAAAWTYQLGIISQNRGDLAEAKIQYRRSLDINERLGNQSGMATTISQLGFVAAEREQLEAAIGLHGRALLIRVGMGIPHAQIDVGKLLELRPLVAEEMFLRTLAAVVGDDAAGEIMGSLDAIEDGGAATPDETTTGLD